jgi:hypothetical protein
MAEASLVYEGRTFPIAKRFLLLTCEMFVKSPEFLRAPYPIRSDFAEPNLGVFLDAVDGATANIALYNAPELDLLCQEFRFASLGRQVAAFMAQHALYGIISLKSALVDVQRRLADQYRQICLVIAGRGDDAETEPKSDHGDISGLGRRYLGLSAVSMGCPRG